MADQNKTSAKVVFCSELLSASDLFAARTRSHKIPVRGQKDFIPSGSDQQRERLQQTLDEHWDLISEERVAKLGNLVKALWIPSDRIVELQSPAGKFWQTMGFSADGKQCLHPEEALYLMECGNLQVFYHELPLSIQEGYERFLSSKTVGLKQYQVFGHLKRLGYVVTRFDASSVPSHYERQLNLPQSRDRPGKQLKRKRSHSSPSRHTEAQDGTSPEKMVGDKDCEREEEDKNPDPSPDLTAPEIDNEKVAPLGDPTTSSIETTNQGRSWWAKESEVDPGPGQQPGQSRNSGSRRWDSIPFPDLGSRRHLPSSLASPDPALLPVSVSVGSCDVTPWLQRLNLREVRMSRREWERERDRDRYRRNINEDREVRHCRNWVEYRELLERRSRRSRRDRPAHLWEGTVTPLHDPGQYSSTGELLDRIRVVQSSRMSDGASRLKGSEDWRISFNIYQPDTVAEFKKSSPGKPYSRMCVCRFDGPVPDLGTLKLLAFQSGDIPVTYAVVDHGDISFYSFKDFQLPTDVSH